MARFRKLVEAGPIGLQPWAEDKLSDYASEIIRFGTLPESEDELVSMVGDADALLVRTLPLVPASVLSRCSSLRYVGMCCSLYSKESANVDIGYAEKHGITVYGIRDYGDKGVTEFVVYALVRILHGYDWPMWRSRPKEITGLRIGFVGFGKQYGAHRAPYYVALYPVGDVVKVHIPSVAAAYCGVFLIADKTRSTLSVLRVCSCFGYSCAEN